METCEILGVHVAVINMNKVIKLIENNLNIWKGNYICIANVHTTVIAHDDSSYLNIQNEAVLTLPDGKPLSIVSQCKGYKNAERVTGPDLMGEVMSVSNNKGYLHYFYGSKPETLDLLQKNLKKRYLGLQIVGTYSPPFRDMSHTEDEDVINQINASGAQFLWVGLGAPKQEFWMAAHKEKVNALMIGVGAAFDFYAGNIRRAPLWMQKASLEWLYRLIQDPKRMFMRYLVTNTKFLLLAVRGHRRE